MDSESLVQLQAQIGEHSRAMLILNMSLINRIMSQY